MKKNALLLPLAGLMIAGSAVTGVTAFANAAESTTARTAPMQQDARVRPAAMGKITAISGSTITLQDMQNSTTYTVDASAATVTKHGKPAAQGEAPTKTTVQLSTLAVGDIVAVRGTVNGSVIAATALELGGGMGMHGGMGHGPNAVRGTVSAVNGSTITVTGKDGTTYTVNASGATATKMQTIDVSAIGVGDTVSVGGTISGSTVTATHIMDGVPPVGAQK
jgi:hypothetical protein